MTNLVCPSCGSISNEIEKVCTNVLINKYEKNYGIKIDFKEPYLKLCKCSSCEIGFYYPMVSGSKEFYSILGKNEWYYGHEDKSEFKFALNYISEGCSVLDIGAGRGEFCSNLPSGVKYLGLEFSESAVASAAHKGINVQNLTLLDLINKDMKFDVIVCFQVLEHLEKPVELVQQVKKLLRNGGKLILATPNNDSILFTYHDTLLNMPPHHILLWNYFSLNSLLVKNKFKVLDVYREPVSPIHEQWFAKAYIKKKIYSLLNLPLTRFSNNWLEKVFIKVLNQLAKILLRLNFISLKQDGHTIILVAESND